ncbi:MAG TPA: enoyl-CoA hydratase/isomerase family protein [Candidatus Binataceae bacterium]|nr:enoyl-CoA hydratase/isomerase family protein [Candidatus Binataceae bacterium]
MPYQGYNCLRFQIDRGVAWVTIDHPPMNLLDLNLVQDLARAGAELEADPEVRVVVFKSADPEFFIAHADVNMILAGPSQPPPRAKEPGPFDQMVDRFRTMPKATIGQIEGRARGGGSEFLLGLDMRFAALGKAVLAQPEVSVGIIPGGGGTQRLPRIIGRARALEVILSGEDFPADIAERYGYVNRALPPAELGPFVERLAYRIASFPAETIALCKQSVIAGEVPIAEGLTEEEHLFWKSVSTPAARNRMQEFVGSGGQSREAELSGIGPQTARKSS